MSNVLNYTEQGGAKTVIGGTLEIAAGASVTGITTATIVDNVTSTDTDKALSANQGKLLKDSLDGLVADNQLDSTATTIAELKTDFNGLLTKLKAAGLMAADS
jgi:hypothetical protein